MIKPQAQLGGGGHNTWCPKKYGNSVTNCYELALKYLISKAIILLCLLEFFFMKRVKDCKDVSVMSPQNEQ